MVHVVRGFSVGMMDDRILAASYGFPILLTLTNLNFRKNMGFIYYV